MHKKVIASVTALAAGAIGAGLYVAAPASGTDTTTISAAMASDGSRQAITDRRPGRRLHRGIGVHGQATVRTGSGFRQVAWQRGLLTAVAGGKLTVRSIDGTTWQWTTNGDTRVRKDGHRADPTKLAVGDFVAVAGPDGRGRTARWVIVPKKVPDRATRSPSSSHG